MIKKRIISFLTAATVFAATFVTSASASPDVQYEIDTDVDNIPSIMQSYGVITFNAYSPSGHQHTNILTKMIASYPDPENTKYESELCIRPNFPNSQTTSYIQTLVNLENVPQIKIGNKGDTLRIGSSHTVYSNGNESFIDGKKVESAGTIIADTAENAYMDIDNLKNSFIKYSQQLKDTPASTSGVSVDLRDQNSRSVTVSEETGIYYVNFTYADSFVNNVNDALNIKFPADADPDDFSKSSVVVINIDMNGYSEAQFKGFLPEINGSQPSNEEASWGKNVNRFYVNLYDSSKENGMYTGKITMTARSFGTLIAPEAEFVTGANWDGFIAVNNASISGEYHRTDMNNPVKPKTQSQPIVTTTTPTPTTTTPTPTTTTPTPTTTTPTPTTTTPTPTTTTPTPTTTTPTPTTTTPTPTTTTPTPTTTTPTPTTTTPTPTTTTPTPTTTTPTPTTTTPTPTTTTPTPTTTTGETTSSENEPSITAPIVVTTSEETTSTRPVDDIDDNNGDDNNGGNVDDINDNNNDDPDDNKEGNVGNIGDGDDDSNGNDGQVLGEDDKKPDGSLGDASDDATDDNNVGSDNDHGNPITGETGPIALVFGLIVTAFIITFAKKEKN